MKKLSAYTVASNCTDLTDIRDGIAEIHEAMKTCVESGKHIPSFYVSRLAKLETKKEETGETDAGTHDRHHPFLYR